MTVREMKLALQDYPEDMEVYTLQHYNDNRSCIDSIRIAKQYNYANSGVDSAEEYEKLIDILLIE